MHEARDRATRVHKARDRAALAHEGRDRTASVQGQRQSRGSRPATGRTTWVRIWGNDQLRQIGLPASMGTDDRDQLGGQLRRKPEANDGGTNDQALGMALGCQAWLTNTLSPLPSGLTTQMGEKEWV